MNKKTLWAMGLFGVTWLAVACSSQGEGERCTGDDDCATGLTCTSRTSLTETRVCCPSGNAPSSSEYCRSGSANVTNPEPDGTSSSSSGETASSSGESGSSSGESSSSGGSSSGDNGSSSSGENGSSSSSGGSSSGESSSSSGENGSSSGGSSSGESSSSSGAQP